MRYAFVKRITLRKANQVVQKLNPNEKVLSADSIKEGMINPLFELKTNMRRLILRTCPTRYETYKPKKEKKVYDLIKNNTKVPVPGVLLMDDSKTVIPKVYMLMTKIEGELLGYAVFMTAVTYTPARGGKGKKKLSKKERRQVKPVTERGSYGFSYAISPLLSEKTQKGIVEFMTIALHNNGSKQIFWNYEGKDQERLGYVALKKVGTNQAGGVYKAIVHKTSR